MQKIESVLRIVRIKNLLIVAITMYTMRLCIMLPLLGGKGMSLHLNEVYFALLVLSTVLITAAGYVINDYFDTRTDLVNRPETVVVGKLLSRPFVIILHWTLSTLGVVFGIIVSIAISKPFLSIVFIAIPGLLWFYSTSYKRQFLVGNILVATLTALVPLMPLLFELPLLYKAYWQVLVLAPTAFDAIKYWVGGYAIFAFLLTLFREIVKDVEDFEGDSEFGRRSLPVVLGISNTRAIAASILMVTLLVIVYLFGAYLNFLPNGQFDYFTFLYLLCGLVVPLFLLIVKVLVSQKKSDYHWASNFSKVIMLIGILYAIPFRFLVG